MSPPERPSQRRRPAPAESQPSPETTSDANTTTCYLRQLRRRRAASQRVVPLSCGCPDPWACRCTDPPLSEAALDGWRNSALHVLRAGHFPVLPIEARRALWRRGGADRLLAELLHDACGGEAA
jgi:hypothetical protein